MRCQQVMDVIDAGPFVEHSQELLDAVHAHIRRCDRCATALALSQSLTTRLESMRPPAPSRDLTQNVMARIAALETGVPEEAGVQERTGLVGTPWRLSWQTAAGALATMAATLLITASVTTSSESVMPSVAVFRVGLFAMPGSGDELVAGAMGTVLYAFGLFALERLAQRERALPRRRGDAENLTSPSGH